MARHFTEDGSTVGSNRGRVSEDAPLVPPCRRFSTRKPVPSLTIFAIINVDYVRTCERGNWRERKHGERRNVEVLIFKRPIFGYLDYRWIAQTPQGCHLGIEVSLASVPTESPRWNLILVDSPRVAGLFATVVPASKFPKLGKKFSTRCRPPVARFSNAITILHARHVRYRAVAWSGGD